MFVLCCKNISSKFTFSGSTVSLNTSTRLFEFRSRVNKVSDGLLVSLITELAGIVNNEPFNELSLVSFTRSKTGLIAVLEIVVPMFLSALSLFRSSKLSSISATDSSGIVTTLSFKTTSTSLSPTSLTLSITKLLMFTTSLKNIFNIPVFISRVISVIVGGRLSAT